MSCDCYLASFLIEYRGSKDGFAHNQGGEVITATATSQNTKEIATFTKGVTRTTDYSTAIRTGTGTFPDVTVEWQPPNWNELGAIYVSSVWSQPVQLADVRSRARADCSLDSWGTPIPFGGWTDDNPQPDGQPAKYQCYWVLVQMEDQNFEELNTWASVVELFGAQSTDNSLFGGGGAFDTGGVVDGIGPTTVNGQPTYALGAAVRQGQFKFTLGPPMIPIKITWDIIDSITGHIESSDSVTLDQSMPSHDVDLTAGTPSGKNDKSVRMANMKIFACPYHLSE